MRQRSSPARRKRKCRKCRESFLPDVRSYHPPTASWAVPSGTGNPTIRISSQHYCSKPQCQQESHRRSHQAHVKKKPLYRQKQILSARRWRKKNGGYWHKRREERPDVAERNRVLQRQRDAKAKGHLANINSIGAVRIEKLSRIGVLIDLANINSIEVPWTLVSGEIVGFLRWSSHLANIKAIDQPGNNRAQSRS